jgi:hypothetical protein
MLVSASALIRTQHLPNTSPERYQLSQLVRCYKITCL